VIVYPDEFLVPYEEEDEAGVVHSGRDLRSGEAWERGQQLAVHGWIYRVSDGRLCDLGLSVSDAGSLAPNYAAAMEALGHG